MFLHLGGARIEKSGDDYYLEYDNLKVKWDKDNTWMITLEEDFKDKYSSERYVVKGMCGNYDKDPGGE